MPALNAQSAILDICREFSESRPNRKVVPSTPRLSFWTVLFRHNRRTADPTSFPGSSLFLPRESTLVSAGHVSPLSKQLPTRVDSLFFKKRREKRMQIFSNWHEDRGMEVISSLFSKDRDAEKIYSLLSAAFQKHK